MTTQEAVDIVELYIIGPGPTKEPIHGDYALAALRELEEKAKLADLVNSMPAGSALCRYDADVPWRLASKSLARFESPEAAIRAATPAAPRDAYGMEVNDDYLGV